MGQARGTRLSMAAEVSVLDPDGRRPSGWSAYAATHASDLPGPQAIGQEARRRALSRVGQRTRPSGVTTVDRRAAPRLLTHLLRPLHGQAIQQERSCLGDALGQQVAHENLTLIDDPLVPRGLGSAWFDADGIAAQRRDLIQAGVLRGQLFDVYTAQKMGRRPTGGGLSNVILQPGQRSQAALIGDIKEGILVTGLLGGNADPNSGDFSHGFKGFAIEDGALGAPLGEMNFSGNHTTLWRRLVAVGADPWLASSLRTPTLVFEGVQVSGR
jgi:PmbA protein